MNDKEIMEGLLVSMKQTCGLMLNGSIEAATQNVHDTFHSAVNSTPCLQSELYKDMEAQGWYPPDTAPQQKIQQTRQKFSAVC